MKLYSEKLLLKLLQLFTVLMRVERMYVFPQYFCFEMIYLYEFEVCISFRSITIYYVILIIEYLC